jgi:hypothetical protein
MWLLDYENTIFDIVVGSKIGLRDLPSCLKNLEAFFVAGGLHLAINPFRCLSGEVEVREVVIALTEGLCDFRGGSHPL